MKRTCTFHWLTTAAVVVLVGLAPVPALAWFEVEDFEAGDVGGFDNPFFITHYPIAAKAFYHKPDSRRPEVTLSADLLAPEGYGEIAGSGQRIEDLNSLIHRIEENNLDPKNYEWYTDLRRYGSVPHSGFGLGLERVLAWICRLEHIRDAVAFPRLINRIYP